MGVDGADHRDQERQELGVGVGVRARVEQVLAVVGRHRPVVVLARAVDARERLLVDQEHQAVLLARGGAWSTSRSCCGRMPTDVGSNTGAISNWPGATSLWRVLAGMPRRHSSRSRSIMNARIRSRIGPKYWSSSSWPLGDGAPNSVRPVRIRSGRCSASRRSTRKYSCSGPMVVNTREAVGCRTSAGPAGPACPAPPGCAAAGSCGRAPRR